jgi:hypothetical protein
MLARHLAVVARVVREPLAAVTAALLSHHVQVDLRSSEELVLDGTSPAFKGASFCSYKRDPAVARVSREGAQRGSQASTTQRGTARQARQAGIAPAAAGAHTDAACVLQVVPDATTYQNGDSDVLHVQIPIMEK